MSVPNKPMNIVRNTDADYNDNIEQLLAFDDGSGSTVSALVGNDFTIQGVEDTDFQWVSAIGGNAVELITTLAGGGILGPVASGDQSLLAGTVVMAIQLTSTLEGGYVWGTGRAYVGSLGNGQCCVYLDGVYDYGIEYKDTTSGKQTSYLGSSIADAWVPVVIRWDSSGPFVEVSIKDGSTKRTQSITPGDGTGLITRDTHAESIGNYLSGSGTAAKCAVGYYMRLNVAISDADVDTYLDTPFLNIKAQNEVVLSNAKRIGVSGSTYELRNPDNTAIRDLTAAEITTLNHTVKHSPTRPILIPGCAPILTRPADTDQCPCGSELTWAECHGNKAVSRFGLDIGV
jgi:hypothetical protein